MPDKEARKDIIKLYLDKTCVDENIDIDKIAELTVYFSGAMIENLVNEASILAVKDNSKKVGEKHLEKAYFNVIAGVDKTNISSNDAQKEITAYHEAGHAFMSKYLMPENKIIKVSIIPTTKGAGGYTLSTPENETIISREKIENQIKVFLAGRGVEEVFLGNEKVTIGAQNDIEKATALTIDYITKYGMCENAGLVNYKVLSEAFNVSLDIEKSVKELINESYNDVKRIINENKECIRLIKDMLEKNETINGDDLDRILEIKNVC